MRRGARRRLNSGRFRGFEETKQCILPGVAGANTNAGYSSSLLEVAAEPGRKQTIHLLERPPLTGNEQRLVLSACNRGLTLPPVSTPLQVGGTQPTPSLRLRTTLALPAITSTKGCSPTFSRRLNTRVPASLTISTMMRGGGRLHGSTYTTSTINNVICGWPHRSSMTWPMGGMTHAPVESGGVRIGNTRTPSPTSCSCLSPLTWPRDPATRS
jgi:hypothetical protein